MKNAWVQTGDYNCSNCKAYEIELMSLQRKIANSEKMLATDLPTCSFNCEPLFFYNLCLFNDTFKLCTVEDKSSPSASSDNNDVIMKGSSTDDVDVDGDDDSASETSDDENHEEEEEPPLGESLTESEESEYGATGKRLEVRNIV